MDKYESIHGKDTSSFDFTSTPAQAFDDLKTNPRQLIPTGLKALDWALAGVSREHPSEPRGIQKGQIVEVWGPPASGKTTLAMQIAANTLRDGYKVVWVGPSSITRRPQVLQSLISALQKLSATRDLLIVVLSQCVTRMQAGNGAAITPAINASAWEQGISTRIVLFQDWTAVDAELRNVRLVGVQKSNGQFSPNGFGLVFPFKICNGGLAGLDLETNQASLALATNPRRQKRKFDETDYEIADSEGEDYGWEDEDEAEMPNMPPQWQGSEDLLLGRPAEDGDDLTAEISLCGNATPVSSPSEHEQ
ncbi:hypothetical protein EKO27_g7636 [Xylaria grammica]|uniref:RecA family profile 1 domain-containing protein n=1 Tax=Xylaria grammica TaxID=363999 RepID=A0A439CZ42_9PEZI|nr:hypothetical protein EKO27_g7636 [Xylaria grammica]